MIKLVISDIDGTLVGDGQGYGALDPEYYEVIHRLRKKGIRFLACSGRQRQSIQKLFRPVADEMLFACDGGSDVYEKGSLLYAKTLEKEMANEIIRDGRQISECDILVCTTERAYCASEDSEMYHWMVDSYGFDLVAVPDLTKDIREEIVKVSLYHRDRAEELTNPWFRPRWEDRVKLNLAGIQWLDCVPTDAGKGEAVRFVQEYLHILPSETIVFGDNQNDIEMFLAAGKSYAVENARQEVREAADIICESYENNGVLKILKNLF